MGHLAADNGSFSGFLDCPDPRFFGLRPCLREEDEGISLFARGHELPAHLGDVSRGFLVIVDDGQRRYPSDFTNHLLHAEGDNQLKPNLVGANALNIAGFRDELPQLFQAVNITARDDGLLKLDESHGCHPSGLSFHFMMAASSLALMYFSFTAVLIKAVKSASVEAVSFSFLKFSTETGS